MSWYWIALIYFALGALAGYVWRPRIERMRHDRSTR